MSVHSASARPKTSGKGEDGEQDNQTKSGGFALENGKSRKAARTRTAIGMKAGNWRTRDYNEQLSEKEMQR